MKTTFAKTFAALAVLAILFFSLGCAQAGKQPGQKACTADAKVCPDGTSVGRMGPDCEFASCPAAPLVGGDRDEHGCIGSAGYEWCDDLQKCLRIWEENCTGMIVGNDRDAHGCIGSAGYSWCESLKQCIRPWETVCAGSLDGSDRDSHGCIGSAGYSWCEGKQKCLRVWEENCTGVIVGNDRDEHGCIGSAGYLWCESLSQCIQPWETPCPGTMPGSDRDSHGCIASAGYTWCDLRQKCIRPWVENCTANGPSGLTIITESFPPFNFKGRDGEAKGQSSAVVRAILMRLGQASEIEVMPWPDAYALAASKPNVALYSTVRTLPRDSLFKWVGPIGYIEEALYAKAGTNLTVASLDGAKKAGKICVVANDSRQQTLSDMDFRNYYTVPSDEACVRDLISGKADLWFGATDTAPFVAFMVGADPGSVAPVYVVEKSELYIAFNKDTPAATVAEWQGALDGIKRDGLYDTIIGKFKVSAADTGGAKLAEIGTAKLASMQALLDSRVDYIALELNAVANGSEAKSGKWDSISPRLAAVSEMHPDAVYWYAMPNGSYYTLAQGAASGSLSDRAYFTAALAGKESVGATVYSKTTGKKVGVIAVPVEDSDGRVTGVLGSSFYLDSFSGEVKERLKLPDYMYFFALAPDGTVALHTDTERILSDSSSLESGSIAFEMREMSLGANGTVDYELDGRLRRAQYVHDPLTGWGLAIGEYLE